jgi:hypothetical protein
MPHPASILPTPYRPPTREEIERARDMYAQGFTVSRILAATDMSLGTFYHWLDGGPRQREGALYPALPRRRVVVGKRRRPLSADRVSLAARLWRTAERQARDIEERLARPSEATPARERDMRMLSMLVRTLRELSAFDAGVAPGERAAAAEEAPPDIDALREDLARRLTNLLDGLAAKRAAAAEEEQGATENMPE